MDDVEFYLLVFMIAEFFFVLKKIKLWLNKQFILLALFTVNVWKAEKINSLFWGYVKLSNSDWFIQWMPALHCLFLNNASSLGHILMAMELQKYCDFCGALWKSAIVMSQFPQILERGEGGSSHFWVRNAMDWIYQCRNPVI